MPAQIFVAPNETGMSIQIVGKGSMAESASVKDLALSALKSDPTLRVEVDLTRCDYLDSTLLGCLLSIHRNAQGRWSVVAPPDVREKVLAPTRLDQVLPIIDAPTPLRSDPVQLDVVCAKKGELAQHMYECHAHLAEINSPQQPIFARIAAQMKRELEQS